MTKISKINVLGVTHEIKDNDAYVKPSTGIPASDLADGVIPDVSAFITKSVNDLTNYYTKTQTENLIGAINQFKYEIAASTSAVTSPQSNVLYLIGPTGSGSDKYEEYVYPNSTTGWVKIGDTSIDLSGYVTTTALNTALASYTTTSDLTTLLSGKVDKVSGKDLSTNDYTTAEKDKLASVASNAQVNVLEGVKVNGTAQTITNKTVDISVPDVPSIAGNAGKVLAVNSGSTGMEWISGGEPTAITNEEIDVIWNQFILTGTGTESDPILGWHELAEEFNPNGTNTDISYHVDGILDYFVNTVGITATTYPYQTVYFSDGTNTYTFYMYTHSDKTYVEFYFGNLYSYPFLTNVNAAILNLSINSNDNIIVTFD